MEIYIESIHFKASQQLRDYVYEKIEHIAHVDHSIVRVNVFMSMESNTKIKKKNVEFKIHAKGQDFFVKKSSNTFENAVVQCVNTMKQILDKQNKKRLYKRRNVLRRAFNKIIGRY